MPARVRTALIAAGVLCVALVVASILTSLVAPAAAAAVAVGTAAAGLAARRRVPHMQYVPVVLLVVAVALSFLFDRWWALLPMLVGGVAVIVFSVWLRYFGPAAELPADVRAAVAKVATLAEQTAAGIHVAATDSGAVILLGYVDSDATDVTRLATFKNEMLRMKTARQAIEQQGMSCAASFVVVRGDQKPVEIDDVTVCSVGHLTRALTDKTRTAAPAVDLENVDLKEYGLSRQAARQVTKASKANRPGAKVQHQGRVTRVVK